MEGWNQNGSYGGWLEGGVEWIQLAQDRDRWWALVNTVMNLRVLALRSLVCLLVSGADFWSLGPTG
jgi:hypothetical protein